MTGEKIKMSFLTLQVIMLILGTTVQEVTESDITEELFLQLMPDTLYNLLVENRTDEIVSEFCPGLTKCSDDNIDLSQPNVTNSKAKETRPACCRPCDCSLDCFAKGTCCSDLERRRSEQTAFGRFTSDGRTCVGTFILNQERNYNIMDKLYLLGQTCLEKSNIHANNSYDSGGSFEDAYINVNGHLTPVYVVVNRCIVPYELNIHDITPVTSLTSNQSYRNLFCAYCNNDGSNLVDWDMTLNCASFKGLQIVTNLPNIEAVFFKVLERKLCSVYWNPPRDTQVDACFSPEHMVSDCPTYVPEYLDSLCKDESYFIPYSGQVLYRNVFCFICNSYHMREYWHLVYPEQQNNRCPLMQLYPGGDWPLSMLLDLKTLSASKSEELVSDKKCPNGLTYNEKLETCLELMCPFHAIKLADQCISVVKRLSGVTMEFQINFIVDTENEAMPDSNLLITKAEDIALTATNGSHYDICEAYIFDAGMENNNVFVSVYVSTVLSSPASITEVYKGFERTLELFNSDAFEKGVILKAEMKDTNITPLELNSSPFIAFWRTDQCLEPAAVSKLQICRYVVFQEYKAFGRDLISVNGLIFTGTEFFMFNKNSSVPPNVAICEETYVERYMNSKQGNPDGHHEESQGQTVKATCSFVLLCILSTSLNRVNRISIS